ncbi:hypothetical protein ACS0TY_032305 [Phlomoides rotata]
MGRGRAPCCDKTKVRTGPWSPAEDLRLINFIQKHGHTNWRALPKQAGLLRCGKSCRLRWINYLSPDVKRGNFTPQEEETIIQLHNSFGNKWSKIASCLPGRTDNEIKNVWNTHLKKRLLVPKSASSSCSITIDENAQKFVGDHDDQVQKAQLEEKSDFMKEDVILDSPSSSSSSSSCVTKSHETTFQPLGEMDISWELDNINLWEIWESLDPNLLEFNNNNIIVEEEKSDEFGKWLRCIENELGLSNCSDGDQMMTTVAAAPNSDGVSAG